MMTKEFITYDQSLALKELGFDEPCFASRDMGNGNGLIQIPIYQQVFRWFREKYKLVSDIRSEHLGYYTSIVNRDVMMRIVMKPVNIFETYEEAENACLDELIKIVKNK